MDKKVIGRKAYKGVTNNFLYIILVDFNEYRFRTVLLTVTYKLEHLGPVVQS